MYKNGIYRRIEISSSSSNYRLTSHFINTGFIKLYSSLGWNCGLWTVLFKRKHQVPQLQIKNDFLDKKKKYTEAELCIISAGKRDFCCLVILDWCLHLNTMLTFEKYVYLHFVQNVDCEVMLMHQPSNHLTININDKISES